ncbi:DUF4099 domain-containing protein [Phocaeicola barnesiae]|uniref:DUF4099 domain-containing protein n=1 Tax=Phocaeicola barnesiae TaxID=376804 RepID=UPI003F5BE1E6
MNRYKFSEEEVPYGILEQFGLTREMIGDLPMDVLQAIHSGRRSPVLPIRVDDSDGNTIHARTRFSLVRANTGGLDGHSLCATLGVPVSSAGHPGSRTVSTCGA